ncbi:hypothetical protein, partial [Rhizobium sp. L43]|uniref:hypothetical protein n=1 Tax=Rhizobium sp. L43 TaxID=2035452 RepID=UPI001AEF5C71
YRRRRPRYQNLIQIVALISSRLSLYTRQSGRLFREFLSNWQPFINCLGAGMVATKKADEFYSQGRCALHHSGRPKR